MTWDIPVLSWFTGPHWHVELCLVAHCGQPKYSPMFYFFFLNRQGLWSEQTYTILTMIKEAKHPLISPAMCTGMHTLQLRYKHQTLFFYHTKSTDCDLSLVMDQWSQSQDQCKVLLSIQWNAQLWGCSQIHNEGLSGDILKVHLRYFSWAYFVEECVKPYSHVRDIFRLSDFFSLCAVGNNAVIQLSLHNTRNCS